MSKQDRQGVRTASELERKYQFDKQFAEIMGINLDTQKSVTELGSSLRSEMGEVSTGLQGELAAMDKNIREDMGEMDSYLSREIEEQSTSMTRTTEAMIIKALERYVETKDFDEFRTTVQTDFQVWADGILGRVTKTEETIASVDSDLQEKFNTITKYFAFTINGLTIGQVDNPYRIVIDNDDITIYSGDKIVQTFKADGTALIPALTVTQSMNLVGLRITSDSTHINIDYGGE